MDTIPSNYLPVVVLFGIIGAIVLDKIMYDHLNGKY